MINSELIARNLFSEENLYLIYFICVANLSRFMFIAFYFILFFWLNV